MESRKVQKYVTVSSQGKSNRISNCKRHVHCQNVLQMAIKGHWSRQKHHTKSMWKSHDIMKIREKMKIPKNMSRNDFR